MEHRRFTVMGVSLVKANVAPPLQLASVAGPCSPLYRFLLLRDRSVALARTRSIRIRFRVPRISRRTASLSAAGDSNFQRARSELCNDRAALYLCPAESPAFLRLTFLASALFIGRKLKSRIRVQACSRLVDVSRRKGAFSSRSFARRKAICNLPPSPLLIEQGRSFGTLGGLRLNSFIFLDFPLGNEAI